MSKVTQSEAQCGPVSLPPHGGGGMSAGWLTRAARVLGISRIAKGDGAGRGFDFVAMHRSLGSLERKSAGE
ncbi:MAG: hypothetical protein Q7R40_01835 [Phaeospirillum sp.]|nr:hypothetical protein [Phaeospirillum sp.]